MMDDTKPVSSNELPLSDEEQTDLHYIVSLSRAGVGQTLNFADDAQYRFLVSRLKRAGRTPQTSPELFQSLERTRLFHVKNGGPPSARDNGNDPETINAITGVETEQQLSFIASGISSIYGGTRYTDVTLQLFDGDMRNQIGPLEQVRVFDSGEYVPIQATGQVQQQGQPATAVMTVVTDKKSSADALVEGTVYTASVLALPKTPPVSTAPVRKSGHATNYVLVCLLRSTGNDADCDYGPYGTNQVVVPLQGTVSYFNNIVTPFTLENANAQLYVASRKDGGGPKYYLPGNLMSTNFSVSPTNPTVLNWTFNLANFGIADPFANYDYVDLVLHFAVTTQGDPNLVDAWVTSATDAVSGPNVEKIYPLQFATGCLAEGTLITLADGTTRPIEQFEGGEQVLVDSGGNITTVSFTNSGPELIPMIRLTDEEGRSLQVTQGHPVVVTDGFRLARLLEVGDEILTAAGKTKIVSIERVEFGGKVWNLKLCPNEEASSSPAQKACTFFANGILVGDSATQSRLHKTHKRKHENILAELPERWHHDYLNSIEQPS